MYCRSYPLLYQTYKVILTLFVTQVRCGRTLSKLRYVKNRLRNQLSEDRFDSLLLMRVERDVFVTHFKPYDHRRTSKNKRRNAKTVAL